VKCDKETDNKIPNNIRGNVYKSTKSRVVLALNFLGYSTKSTSSILFVFTQQVTQRNNNNNNNNNNSGIVHSIENRLCIPLGNNLLLFKFCGSSSVLFIHKEFKIIISTDALFVVESDLGPSSSYPSVF